MTEAPTPWSSGRLARGGRSRRTPGILFGASYEDERIELDVFGRPGRICVVAGSGETAAGCAAAGHAVTAVDINPTQLAYARARCAGGATVVGTAERGMAVARALLKVVAPAWRRDRLLSVLASAGPAVAGEHWRTSLDSAAFARLLALALRPGSVVAGWLQPDFAAFVPSRFDLDLRARLADGLGRHGTAQNRFAWRLLAGAELPGWTMPRLGDVEPITWLHADIAVHLESVPPGHYDGISLSNVFDGAPAAFDQRLRTAASRAVRPGGPVIIRTFAPPGADGPGRAADDAAMLWGSVQV